MQLRQGRQFTGVMMSKKEGIIRHFCPLCGQECFIEQDDEGYYLMCKNPKCLGCTTGHAPKKVIEEKWTEQDTNY